MTSKLLGQQPVGRVYAVVFESGDDLLEGLQRFFTSVDLQAAKLSGLGGFRRATLAYYDIERKQYLPIEVDEQVEVLSVVGNVATYEEKPRVHMHCIVGHRDGHTTGGHLLAAVVQPTLELIIEEIAVGLRRTDRPEIGIPLLDIGTRC
jgi:uncharacterized protein